MAAWHAARLSDRPAAVPEHARIRIFPVDRKSFIDLYVLTGFHAAPAQNALVRIVTIERIRAIDRVRLGPKWNALMFNGQQFGRVMNSAVSVVVVTNSATEKMVAENAVERLDLRSGGSGRFRRDFHPFNRDSRARPR